MMGLILRVPFTSIPPILTDIARGLHISVSSLGILTTIPLLFIGTALIGIGIAMLNVLMPSAVMTYFPNKIGKLTAIYTTVMTCATALMSALAVPIIWTILLAITFVIWLPNIKREKQVQAEPSTDERKQKHHESAWRPPKAWIMLVFSGLQSLLFYTGLTWLPTMATEAGLSQTLAGNLSGIYSLIGIPLALVLPAIVEASSLRQRQLLMGFFDALGIIGIVMLFWQQSSFTYWLIVSLLIGCAAGALFPYLMTTFSLKATIPEHSAELSGMSQSGGYLIASVGPFLFGYGPHVIPFMDVCNGMLLGLDYYHDDCQSFIGTRRKNLLKKSVTSDIHPKSWTK